YLAVHTLNRLGATRTMEDFLGFITTIAAREANGELKPVYAILPDRPLEEVEVPTLKGYRGMGPVRIGNLAQQQIQNDSYGSVILAAAQMFFDRRLPRQGDLDLYMRLEKLGNKAVEKAFQPDSGIWEFRGRRDVHTHSVAQCWAACDRLSKIAGALGQKERVSHWHEQAEAIRHRLLKEAWNAELGTFVSVLGGKDVDASLLLLQELGLVGASDPRFVGTLEAITRILRRRDHLFRYTTSDDFGLPQNSFTVFTFWY